MPIYRFTIASLEDEKDTDTWDVEAPDEESAYDKAYSCAFTAGWYSLDSRSVLKPLP